MATMIDVLLWVFWGLAIILLTPLVIYMCAKMATLGYYRARKRWAEMEKREQGPTGQK